MSSVMRTSIGLPFGIKQLVNLGELRQQALADLLRSHSGDTAARQADLRPARR